MRKGILIFLALFVLGFSLGPRVTWTENERMMTELPADLDAWLTEKESKISGIRSGLEKGIQWATPSKEQTPLSLVFLHGFSASRKELSPVVEEIGTRLKANVFFTRLFGHGLDGEALGKATTKNWVDDGYEALAVGKRIGKKVVLIGNSTGAALATWLAVKTGEVDGLVLLSPNFALKDKRSRLFLWPWGIHIAQLIAGKTRSWTPENALQAHYWTTSYPVSALAPIMTLSKEVSKLELEKIHIPLLTVYTPHDDRVDTELVVRNFERFGSQPKKLVRLDEAKTHVMAGDATSPSTTAKAVSITCEFLEKL